MTSINNIKSSVALLLMTGIIALSIDITICVDTTVENVSIEKNTKSCCSSFKTFQCNNVTGPLTITCDKTNQHHIILLQPHRTESDQFAIIEGPENFGKGVLLLGTHRLENFCIGTLPDEKNETENVALVCMKGLSVGDNEPIDYILYSSGLLVSVICGLLTLTIYFLLPWLRDLQGKIIMSLLVCVCIGYSSLATIQVFTKHITHTTCIFTGFMVYFWLFASFNWLHISSFNIWRTIVLRNNHALFKDKKLLFIVYSIVGWGVPIIHLIISLILEYAIEGNTIRPGIGEVMCFIHDNRNKWILFYGPILIIILANTFYFISVVYHLGKMHKIQSQLDAQRAAAVNYKEAPSAGKSIVRSNTLVRKIDQHKKKITASVVKFNTYSKLFFAMGLTFIFEIISAIYHSQNAGGSKSRVIVFLLMVMDLINSLQGFILFIILILLRRKVLLKLGEKMNINFKKICPCLLSSEGQADEDDCSEEYDTSQYDDNDQRRITNNVVNGEQRIIEEIQMM